MYILHFSTDDLAGGAAKAAFRLHSAFREAGHRSRIVVRRKISEDDDVIQASPLSTSPWQSRFDRLRRQIPMLRTPTLFTPYTFNFNLEPELDTHCFFDQSSQAPDILCLHWIDGLLNARLIRELYNCHQCPIAWILADQEPMTGGCHYSFGCIGYQYECGRCPQLESTDKHDHTYLTWHQKKKYLSNVPICFVAPTNWGVDRIRASSLFREHRIELIPYPINTAIFRPLDQRIARDLMHLPPDKKVIFIGATYLEERRKGMAELLESLTRLVGLIDGDDKIEREDIFLFIAGSNGRYLMENSPFEGKCLGPLNDELTLALAYQAADIFLCPSIEDAGPMMIPEAMLCGTPVVAFNTGGAPDLIKTMSNGYLAMLADTADFAHGIYVLLTSDCLPAMRDAAYEAAIQAHSPSIVIDRHLELFRSLQQCSTRTPKESREQ